MPNFRPVDRNLKFIAVDFEAQILPGTFEHAVSVLVDQELDLTPFIETYRNDDTGAPAYHAPIPLKVVLFGYRRGMISSRAIAAACRQHVKFIALSACSHPDFSTIAGFVSLHAEAIPSLFTQVLVICNREGLIGHEMFAIDWVKLPSNAAKSRLSLRENAEPGAQNVAQSVEKMVAEHQRKNRWEVRARADRWILAPLAKLFAPRQHWAGRDRQVCGGPSGDIVLGGLTEAGFVYSSR